MRLVRQLAQSRGTLDEAEVAAVRVAGFSDAQLVEISLAMAVATFANTFSRINDAAIDLPPVDWTTAALSRSTIPSRKRR